MSHTVVLWSTRVDWKELIDSQGSPSGAPLGIRSCSSNRLFRGLATLKSQHSEAAKRGLNNASPNRRILHSQISIPADFQAQSGCLPLA